MNDSGIAVRKLIARERAPLHEVLVVTDDFSLPFGKMRFREGGSHGGHNGLRSIIDELHTEAFPRLRIGIGEPGRDAVDHVLSVFRPEERQRLDELLDAAADAVEAWAREGVSQGGQPLQRLPAPAGRRDAHGAAGRGRRPARPGRRAPDADGLAPDPPGRRGAMTGHASSPGGPRPPGTGRPSAAARADPRPLGPAAAPPRDGAASAALDAALAAGPGPRGRHAAVTAVPHGAKSFLVAALARADGDRVCWIARDAEIGDRVADELVGLAGRPGRGRRPGAAVRPGLRAQRADPRRVGGPRRDPRPLAERPGPGPRRLRPGAPPADDPPGRPPGPAARPAPGRPGPPGRPAGRAPARSATSRSSRSPGAARWPAGAASSTSSRPAPTSPSGSSSSATRSTRSGSSTPPTSGRSAPAEAGRAPAGQRVPRPGRRHGRASARGSGALAGRLPERLAADLARLEGEAAAPPAGAPATPSAVRRRVARPARRAPSTSATRPRSGRPSLCPASGLDHLDPETLLVVDEPGEVAAAAEFLWEQAAERRRDLVGARRAPRRLAGRLPGAARLEGAPARRPDPRADLGAGPGRGDRRRRRPSTTPSAGASRSCRPGRSAGLARAIERWRAGRPASVPLAEEEAEDARRAVPAGHRRRRAAPRGRTARARTADRPRLGPGRPPRRAARRGRDPGRGHDAPRACRRRAPSRSSGAA